MRRAVKDAENSPTRAGGCDSEQGKWENEIKNYSGSILAEIRRNAEG
jgi:hypothetical protein